MVAYRKYMGKCVNKMFECFKKKNYLFFEKKKRKYKIRKGNDLLRQAKLMIEIIEYKRPRIYEKLLKN